MNRDLSVNLPTIVYPTGIKKNEKYNRYKTVNFFVIDDMFSEMCGTAHF